MRWVLIAAALLVAVSLAGCGSKTDTTSSSSGTVTATTTTSKGTASGTSTTPASGHSADISATITAGTAPLNVTFGLASSPEAKSWQVVFGDGGSPAKGDAPMPASVSHVYSVGGNFTATLTVTFKDSKTASDPISIQVGVPDTGPAPPAHFDLGPAGGCEGSVQPGSCVSFQAGPSQPAVDGHWVALDSRYWGKAFSSTINPPVLGDSDCYFVATDEKTIVGTASNSDKPCGGVVPATTAWLFIYSYVEPEQAMAIDFVL